MNTPEIFQNLTQVIQQQQEQIAALDEKLKHLQIGGGGGGGGNATIEDYTLGHVYPRNTLIVWPETETVYRAIKTFTARNFNEEVSGDGTPGSIKLKLVGFESSIVTYGQKPTQEQVDNLPQDTLVAIYDSSDDPYDLT